MSKSKNIFDFGELEGVGKSTGDSLKSNQKLKRDIPDSEVSAKKRRRSFSRKFKLRILNELDGCTKTGQLGAILRREGLYSSNVEKWREQIDQEKKNKKSTEKYLKKIAELSKQNSRLKRKLYQAKLIIDAQKKISEILELTELS
jgi:transposase